MKIYRVARRKDILTGVYRAKGFGELYDYWAEGIDADGGRFENDEHPLPDTEGYYIDPHQLCCFVSWSQMMEWFSVEALEWFYLAEFVVWEIEAERDLDVAYIPGTRQALIDDNMVSGNVYHPMEWHEVLDRCAVEVQTGLTQQP